MSAWKTIRNGIAAWRHVALPGAIIIGLVTATRLTGILQWLEWKAFDQGLRLRPAEAVDERILIVGINEADIQRTGTYPIPDGTIAALLKKLQADQPAVIGLDIVRDLPVQPGHTALVEAFKNQRVIAVEKVLPMTVKPPPMLPPDQIGLSLIHI